MVQPSVPWPVFRNRLGSFVLPIIRHVARRQRAQAGPELGLARIARAGEQLARAAGDGFATHVVEVAVVAVELGSAGDAQAVAIR
jgi:hypothetical protein